MVATGRCCSQIDGFGAMVVDGDLLIVVGVLTLQKSRTCLIDLDLISARGITLRIYTREVSICLLRLRSPPDRTYRDLDASPGSCTPVTSPLSDRAVWKLESARSARRSDALYTVADRMDNANSGDCKAGLQRSMCGSSRPS